MTLFDAVINTLATIAVYGFVILLVYNPQNPN